ncbi:hypothetical protein BO70DRAFT_379341 [Aspergillus heteromorphus CBS 117.55]|uniref:Uncharacterized protein n=1 Tax=Aspergillus heteromorphus CBS 117.55 TaxID=1448321 RepID=A0A317WCR9_9EURO|nr:uncharacterized protein BO70DRAFT_379341 [Aspergillus heteromorphus CBS 117.55]PWY83561.1 hypothetical protein BO70DRAFT_379341 [Aspergillus heteromorphus CBS 117.55]
MDPPFIENFRSIGQNIYLHEPSATPQSPDPALIIICTWFGGATPRRISKYTTRYRQNYPDTSILLLVSSIRDFTVRSFNAVDPNLTPARDSITRILQSNPNASILLHVFSNGGCNTVTHLARSMKDASLAGGVDFKSALKLIVFDCCPGDTSFQRFWNAAAVALPTTQPGRALGSAVLYPTARAVSALQSVGVMRSIDVYRAELNDPAVFGKPARRLYLYSLVDDMIPWEEVERHLDEARERGYEAGGVRFEDGRHCALVMSDEERYWGAVRRAWEGREGFDRDFKL